MTKFIRSINLLAAGALLTAGLGLGVFFAPEAVSQGNAVTPKTAAPAEARVMSRAFAATAKALRPSVVRIDVETVAPKGQKRAAPGNPHGFEDGDVPEFFKRFFGEPEFPMPGPGRGTGSGLLIDTAGNIVTNSHVVANAEKVTVTFSGGQDDGKEYEAKVIGADKETDVAVVRLINPPTSLTAARLGNSDALDVGEWVLAIGSPLGMDQTVTAGIISGTGKTHGRMALSGSRVGTYIQTDAKINPGNSGGPLVNLDGEVIGINTLINTGPGGAYGFAIPINVVRRVSGTLIKDGRMRYAYLGIRIEDLANADEEARKKLGGSALPTRAAVVREVTPGGPAEKSGIRASDVITKIDAQVIEGASDVVRYISQQPIGGKVVLSYLRDGQRRTTNVALAELPDEEKQLASADDQRIGIAVQTLTPDLGRALGLPDTKGGAVITEVAPGTRAAAAGLKPEDVIVKVNRAEVKDADDTIAALKKNTAGSQLLQVRRGGKVLFITVPAAK